MRAGSSSLARAHMCSLSYGHALRRRRHTHTHHVLASHLIPFAGRAIPIRNTYTAHSQTRPGCTLCTYPYLPPHQGFYRAPSYSSPDIAPSVALLVSAGKTGQQDRPHNPAQLHREIHKQGLHYHPPCDSLFIATLRRYRATGDPYQAFTARTGTLTAS